VDCKYFVSDSEIHFFFFLIQPRLGNRYIIVQFKKVDKWILLCCTVVVEYFIVMELLDVNLMINHRIQKSILSGDYVSS